MKIKISNIKMDASGIKCARVAKGAKVPGFKGVRVTRLPRLKGQFRNKVFLRTHLRSSLSPEEGPSCLIFIIVVRPVPSQMMGPHQWLSQEDGLH